MTIDKSTAVASLYGGTAAAPAPAGQGPVGAAAALYDATPAVQPNTPPAAAPLKPTASPPAAGGADQAGTLYDAAPASVSDLQVPENIAALRAQTPADRATAFYGETLHGSFSQHLGNDNDAQGATLQQRTAVAHEVARISRDLGMTDPADMLDLVKRAKAAAPAAAARTAEQVQASQGKALAALQAEYGDRTAQVLADTQALVKRDPRVSALLARSGLGDDPATVMQFARLSQRQRTLGRLPK